MKIEHTQLDSPSSPAPKQIPCLPTGVNVRLVKFCLPVRDKCFIAIISVYALPTTTCTDEIREQFYASLDVELRDTPVTDKFVILGDFNAGVGRDEEQRREVTWKHGVGKMNCNGLLLLSKCNEHNLLITNAIFRLANKYKTSWMHPRSKQWHLIDYITTRQRDSSDVLITSSMRGAECWTDHRLTRAKLNIRIVPQHHKLQKLIRQAFNTAKLFSAKYQQEFQSNLDDKFETIG